MRHNLLILFCCTVAILGGISLFFPVQSHQSVGEPRLLNCSESMTWRIGRIDPRYNIEESALKELMGQVSELWSEAVGKQIVTYSDSGEVAIHFIYSKEQEFTESEQELARRIKRERVPYDTLKNDYQLFSARYDDQLQQYNQVVTEYNKTVNRFDQLITNWNTQGGVPKEEEEQMNRKIKELLNEIQREKEHLNRLAEEVINVSDRLNNQADHVNALIYHYNNRFIQKRAFHQGRYIHVGGERKINIYQFENRDKLRLVLAHEVGHALGLRHLQDPESVMFYKMEQQDGANLTLSQQDVAAIRALCESTS